MVYKDVTGNLVKQEHPLAEQVDRYRGCIAAAPRFNPTGRSRADYLNLIEKVVRFFHGHQADFGGIIDPYFKRERHYSTPSYALGAALLVANGRVDLLDSAERAMICACEALSVGKAPDQHADFFTIFLMKADELLAPIAAPQSVERWRSALSRIDPEAIYMVQLATRAEGDIHNWNAINCVGEYLRHKAGLGGSSIWWEKHLPYHTRRFDDFGLYRDGEMSGTAHPLAYDAVTRYMLSVLLDAGYDGQQAAAFDLNLYKGAWTSLFVQTPGGEWPGVGRSAHHQWNDAALAVCYEWAAHRFAGDDPLLAAACKRGARLSLMAIEPWLRSGGDLFIVRNRFEPEVRHGYERYSVHATYNLWTVAALSLAYLMADDSIPEQPIPGEVGSYTAKLGAAFHQVIAVHQGFGLQIETRGDPSANPTGVVRVNRIGCNPQIGPSEGAVSAPRYATIGPTRALALGPAWLDSTGRWHSLAENVESSYPSPYAPPEVTVLGDQSQDYNEVRLVWRGLPCLRALYTEYKIGAGLIRVLYRAEGQVKGLRAELPLFDFDGQTHSKIECAGSELTVTFGGSQMRYRLLDPALHFTVTDERAATRAGLLRYAFIDTDAQSIEFTMELYPLKSSRMTPAA